MDIHRIFRHIQKVMEYICSDKLPELCELQRFVVFEILCALSKACSIAPMAQKKENMIFRIFGRENVTPRSRPGFKPKAQESRSPYHHWPRFTKLAESSTFWSGLKVLSVASIFHLCVGSSFFDRQTEFSKFNRKLRVWLLK